MLSNLKNSSFSKSIWIFMTLYFINLSIDVQYDNRWFKSSTLDENETLIELLIEDVLDYEDAVADQNNLDTDEIKIKKSIFLIFISQTANLSLKTTIHSKGNSIVFSNLFLFLKSLADKIHTPPPEIIA